MSAGYGRGYYGSAQLAPRRRSGGGWFTIAAVAGLGAVIWWWVLPAVGPKPKYVAEPESKHEEDPTHSSSSSEEDLSQLARARGFSSTKTYEDSVVASARELKASGAKIVLAPPLQHLASRVES